MPISNPYLFIGEPVGGSTTGAPLSSDANGLLASGISAIEVSSTATATAPTGTDALMTTMSITPTPGTYLAVFSCDINSAVSGAAISVSFYIGGTQKADSLRKIIPFSGGTLTSGSGRGAVCLNSLVTIAASQDIEVRWSTSNAGPTAAARTFNLVRLS